MVFGLSVTSILVGEKILGSYLHLAKKEKGVGVKYNGIWLHVISGLNLLHFSCILSVY